MSRGAGFVELIFLLSIVDILCRSRQKTTTNKVTIFYEVHSDYTYLYKMTPQANMVSAATPAVTSMVILKEFMFSLLKTK